MLGQTCLLVLFRLPGARDPRRKVRHEERRLRAALQHAEEVLRDVLECRRADSFAAEER